MAYQAWEGRETSFPVKTDGVRGGEAVGDPPADSASEHRHWVHDGGRGRPDSGLI